MLDMSSGDWTSIVERKTPKTLYSPWPAKRGNPLLLTTHVVPKSNHFDERGSWCTSFCWNCTLPERNISPLEGWVGMTSFIFHWWDMFVPWSPVLEKQGRKIYDMSVQKITKSLSYWTFGYFNLEKMIFLSHWKKNNLKISNFPRGMSVVTMEPKRTAANCNFTNQQTNPPGFCHEVHN